MADIERKTTKLKITCIQMDSKLECPDENYDRAEQLIQEAIKEQPDVIVLPEIWENMGTLRKRLSEICCKDGDRVKRRIGGLAKKYKVNIVAGSVYDMHNGSIYNTAFIFDRRGECVAAYDKTHLVFPGEFEYVAEGDRVCSFTLDGVKCGIVICNDMKFPEPMRKLALSGIEILFVPSAWTVASLFRLEYLRVARAIENQYFVVNCNSCSTVVGTVYGGKSAIVSPWGKILAEAGETEEIFSAECDLQLIDKIRSGGQSIFARRRPELY